MAQKSDNANWYPQEINISEDLMKQWVEFEYNGEM